MAVIARLGVKQLSADVDFGTSGTTAFTADDAYLLSVVITNKLATDGKAFVYVVPSGETDTTKFGLIAHNLNVTGNNSYETFRFGVNNTDVVKVAGSAGMAFYIQGIDQVTA